ncbi:MAG: thymidine phosphorylase [Alphaproteobacteria bacterium]|nr:thymidine phosphorylase [Alphaproteobacteria bacterium]
MTSAFYVNQRVKIVLVQEIIRHKRDCHKLSQEELNFIVQGIVDWSVSESQIAAFVMACYLRGLDLDESANLTLAMAKNGRVMDWSSLDLNGPVLDKHSTGGVGDKTSIVLAPILAACGAYVPMISGVGLSYTGGTVDKMDAIPGYQTSPSLEKFYETTRNVGCAIIGQTGDLALADKRIYAVRNSTGTIESLPLIASSIVSKKIAAGVQGLVFDLKCGNGAFMKDVDKSRELATIMVEIAQYCGVSASAVISDMNCVMGRSVGNAVEVEEAIRFLRGDFRDERLYELVSTLAKQVLASKGLIHDEKAGQMKINQVLNSGLACEKFAQMVASMGGPVDLVENLDVYFPKSEIVYPVFAKEKGYISSMNAEQIGLTLSILGGGRNKVDAQIDYNVGYSNFKTIGEYVDSENPIAFIHARTQESFASVEKIVQNAITISDEKPVNKNSVIIETLNKR